MPQAPALLARALGTVDRLSEVSGRLFAWLIAPLIVGVTYEVVARYAFNAPTIWAYDLSYMLYTGIFMLGGAYTLRRGSHIRTDFFYNGLAPRAQAMIDLVGYALFIPVLALFFAAMTRDALHSWAIRERSAESAWYPPLYPLKWAMVAGLALLLLQSLAELTRAILVVRGPRAR